ncbi:MAG: nitrilase-related carbon-nitrogen hydrolase [Desulfobacterales bacterium]|jgi:N-carbamoylputrescine amidase
MKDIRIAAVTAACPVGKIEANLSAMEDAVRRSASGGAALVCFPELNMTGYCNRPEMAAAALFLSGPEVEAAARMAETYRIVILAGMAEKGDAGRVYASHLVLTPEGEIGVYRKVHVAPPERSTFSAGNQIPVFDAAGIRFGVQLCYDAHFPELSAAMAAKGAEVIFIPHASPRGEAEEKHLSWMRHLPARAFDNSVFIVAANQTGENCNGLTFPGNIVVLDPSGEVIGKDLSGQEGILFADLKQEALERVRGHEMRYFFPNRRPELYTS